MRTTARESWRAGLLASMLALILTLFSACARDRSTAVRFIPGECPEGTISREQTLEDGTRRLWCERPGDAEGPVKHGPFSSWHPNGQMASQSSYVDGLQHGPITIWFESGQKSQEGAFRHGLPHGRWEAWLEDGTRVYIMDFRDGEIVCGEDPLQPRCR